MASFFSALFNHKKTVFLAVLLFVLGGVFVPHMAFALEVLETVSPKRVFVPRPTSLFPENYPGNLQTFTINGQNFTFRSNIWVRYESGGFQGIQYDWTEWLFNAPNGEEFMFPDPILKYKIRVNRPIYLNATQLTIALDPTFAQYANFNTFKRRIQLIACPNGASPPAGDDNPNSGEVLPNSKDAAENVPFPIADCSNVLVIDVEDPASFGGIFNGIVDGMTRISDFFSEFSAHWSLSWNEFFTFLLVELTNLASGICYWIAHYAGAAFRYILTEFIQDPENRWTITKGIGISAVFLSAWDTVKSYANILIVLALVAAAIMLILQIREWSDKAKALLPQIILVALLVNFSVVFVGIMIDASNLIIQTLTVGADGEIDILLKVNDAWNKIARPLRFPIDIGQAIYYFFISTMFNVIYLMIAATFLYFCFIAVWRYMILAFLFIVSPLAFVFRILPSGEATKLWGQWWHQFIKYCFILIPAAFVLRLSVDILNNPALVWTATGTESLIRILFNFTVVICFLVIGLGLAIKSADSVVKSAIGLTTKLTGKVIAGSGWVAGKGFGIAGKGIGAGGGNALMRKAKDIYDYRKEQAVGALEKAGIMTPGTRNTMESERLKKNFELDADSKKKMDNATPDQVKGAATGFAVTDAGKKQKVYAIQKMFADGSINTLPAAEKRKLAQYVIERQQGDSASTITKSQAGLADLDEKGINKFKAKGMNDVDALKAVKGEKYNQMDDIKESETDTIAELEKVLAEKKEAEERGNIYQYSDADVKRFEKAVKDEFIGKVKNTDGKTINAQEKSAFLDDGEKIYGINSNIRKKVIDNDIRAEGFSETAIKAIKQDRIEKEQKRQGLPELSPADMEKEIAAMPTTDEIRNAAVRKKVQGLSAYDKAKLNPHVVNEVVADEIAKDKEGMKSIATRGSQKLKDKIYHELFNSIVADAESGDKAKIANISEKLANIPKDAMEEAINESEPKVQAKIKALFGKQEDIVIAGTADQQIAATQQDADRLNRVGIQKARMRGDMPSEIDFRAENKRRVGTGLPQLTLQQSYEEAHQKATAKGVDNMPALVKPGDQITIPGQAATTKSADQTTQYKAVKEKVNALLRKQEGLSGVERTQLKELQTKKRNNNINDEEKAELTRLSEKKESRKKKLTPTETQELGSLRAFLKTAEKMEKQEPIPMQPSPVSLNRLNLAYERNKKTDLYKTAFSIAAKNSDGAYSDHQLKEIANEMVEVSYANSEEHKKKALAVEKIRKQELPEIDKEIGRVTSEVAEAEAALMLGLEGEELNNMIKEKNAATKLLGELTVKKSSLKTTLANADLQKMEAESKITSLEDTFGAVDKVHQAKEVILKNGGSDIYTPDQIKEMSKEMVELRDRKMKAQDEAIATANKADAALSSAKSRLESAVEIGNKGIIKTAEEEQKKAEEVLKVAEKTLKEATVEAKEADYNNMFKIIDEQKRKEIDDKNKQP